MCAFTMQLENGTATLNLVICFLLILVKVFHLIIILKCEEHSLAFLD